MNYYNETQFIAAVDTHDTIIGSVEKWEAHKKGILHRAFTVAIRVGNSYVVQVRKHPVFDSVLDISCSSHPIFIENTEGNVGAGDVDGDSDNKDGQGNVFEGLRLQKTTDAVKIALAREWKINSDALPENSVFKGKVMYKAHDHQTEYIEHEVCHIYEVEMPEMPVFEPEFAHGAFLIPQNVLMNENNPLRQSLAPWVVPMLDTLSPYEEF